MKKVLIALCILSSLNTFSASENVIRKISVTGNSEREIMPDTAILNFKIESKNRDLNLATNDVNQKLERFKNALRKQKIQADDIKTVSFYDEKIKEREDEIEGDRKNFIQNKKVEKTPTSYTAEMSIFVRDIDFNRLANLMDVNSSGDLNGIKKDFKENLFVINLKEKDKTIDGALNKLFEKMNVTKDKLQSINTGNNIVFGSYKINENFDVYEEKWIDMFSVTHNLTLKVKDLKKLNTIIALADDNGLNIDGSIKFDLSNKGEIESKMYKEAYDQAKQKATSILKSSSMRLGEPIVVSEDVDFQQKMIDRIDKDWTVESGNALNALGLVAGTKEEYSYSADFASARKRRGTVDYTPKPLKLTQDVSVMYEILQK
ncbi:SIMPL domain-containing protein [Leptotrichia sp.]